ncbi:GrpB family protein [Nocardiopsis sp. CNT-189]|uniref:GrpB family protein n=1 Tax=Nocardiopsis oceanisediminis TaxID=2816862 RepID=UPI003B2ADD99
MSPSTEPPAPLPVRGADPDVAAAVETRHFDRATGRVLLVEPDPKWPYLFQREVERLRGLLGEAALGIEHVGSTAVPGLAAKPCVDILLLVADPEDEEAYRPALEGAGYRLFLVEPERSGHRGFKGPDVNVNLHVYPEGPEARRMLRFRDRLRSSAGDRELYERTKRELAERTWGSVREYGDAKTGVVDEILSRAGGED